MKWNPWLLKGSGIFFGDRASSCGAWKANVIRELQSPTHSLSSFGHLVKDSKFMVCHFHCISLSQYLSVFVQLIKKKKEKKMKSNGFKIYTKLFSILRMSNVCFTFSLRKCFIFKKLVWLLFKRSKGHVYWTLWGNKSLVMSLYTCF